MALFLAVHLAVPISRLGSQEVAARFAWQMFSIAREAPQFVVVTDSETHDVSLDDFMAGARGEVDTERLMPPHLCEVFPGAIRVTWQSGVYEC